MNKTYGVIFYKYDDKLILYLKKNSKDYYEDFSINDINIEEKDIIKILSNINILCRVENLEKNHTILLLNINKYDHLFENLTNYNYVSFKRFISLPFHRTLKHNKLKINDLDKSLNIIKNNYIIRKLI